MPLYRYRCPGCGRTEQHFRKIENRGNAPFCSCGADTQTRMEKILEAPAVRGDYAGYSCPVTGNWIEGRRAHEENLKKHGCRVLESGEVEDVKRRRRHDDEKLEAAVDETVDRFIAELPTAKRDRLAAEVEGGLDVSIERK